VESTNPPTNYLRILTAILHPISTGSTHISSSDSLSPPLIDPKLLLSDVDMELMVKSVEFIIKVVQESDSFKSIGGAKLVGFDKGVREYIKRWCAVVFHPVSSRSNDLSFLNY
jgi:hypothetical protein